MTKKKTAPTTSEGRFLLKRGKAPKTTAGEWGWKKEKEGRSMEKKLHYQ